MNEIKFQRLTLEAVAPERGHEDDAGLDIRSTVSLTLPPQHRTSIPTGLAFEIEKGWYGRVAPRSKLADKFGIDILAGVVDAGYIGEVMINVVNHGLAPFEIRKGDKIAQLIIEKICTPVPVEVRTLADTARGKSGINDVELRLR